MNVSDSEMLADYERRIAEGTDLKGLLPVGSKAPPIKARRSVFSVRLGSDELASITMAARKRGLSIGDFIREAAKQEAALEEGQGSSDYSLEAFKADYDELGRKLERSISSQKGKSKAN